MKAPITQTVAEKAAAIGSVLFLLEDHFRLLRMGRVGSCIHYPRIIYGCPPPRNPYAEESWVVYQAKLARMYRLGAVRRALNKLEEQYPHLAQAVKARYVEVPPLDFIDPDNGPRWALEGLLFMARDIPGDVPHHGQRLLPPAPQSDSRTLQVLDLRDRGFSYKRIAHRMHMSERDIREILRRRETPCDT